jgi:hypothetical protein
MLMMPRYAALPDPTDSVGWSLVDDARHPPVEPSDRGLWSSAPTSDKVTIELPDELARRARVMAAAGHRRLEDAVVEWIRRDVTEHELKTLPDDEILRLCDATLRSDDQEERSGLLADSREGRLDATGHARVEELMALYRRGLVLKAPAWEEAVTRGLRTPPNDADHAP